MARYWPQRNYQCDLDFEKILRKLQSLCHERYVQSGKKSSFVAIIDEFCTFDLMEIHVKKPAAK